MNVDDLLRGARDAMTARTVFAEPIERDGDNAAGGGFGLAASPAGAYVVREGRVRWEPAIDIDRIVLGGQFVVIVALLVLRSIMRRRV